MTLPVHLTSFVGRRAELAAVSALLRGRRLVTLTGVGGSGKTRLAAQLAADLAERWPDGVWWVELEAVTDPAQVAEVAAATVGVLVEPVQGSLRSLTAHLRDRRALVCLDNCEQVLEGAAEVAQALRRSGAEVTVLTTSREPLGVAGETVWQVPPLSEDDALALFLERASLVRPGFTLDVSSEDAVRTMCRRLDGIPLALELAAAWLRTLTPRQIAAGLDDRFALLVGGPRGVAPRQQTLAASIEWSHALLAERDRIVLRRLAVFAGGFGLEAAQAVAAGGDVARDDVLSALRRLVDKSLVIAEERDGEARYRLLETIRQYAADRLVEAGEAAATRDRHLAWLLAFAGGLEPELQRDLDAWRTRLERERDNLRGALDWGLAAPDPERGRRLAAGLPWLWHLHRHGREGLEYLRRAIDRAPDDRSTLQARLLTGIALVADTASPLDLEFDAAQRALAIATEQGDEQLRALCLVLSAVGRFYTDFGAAWALTVDAAGAAEAAGDAFVPDAARALQGIILHLRDRHQEAEPLWNRPSRDSCTGIGGSPRPPSPSRPAARSPRAGSPWPGAWRNGRSASPSRSATTSGSAAPAVRSRSSMVSPATSTAACGCCGRSRGWSTRQGPMCSCPGWRGPWDSCICGGTIRSWRRAGSGGRRDRPTAAPRRGWWRSPCPGWAPP